MKKENFEVLAPLDLIEQLETIFMSNPRNQKVRERRAQIVSELGRRNQSVLADIGQRIRRIGYESGGNMAGGWVKALAEIADDLGLDRPDEGATLETWMDWAVSHGD